MVQYSTLNEMLEPHAISNPIIASYITTYVRLHNNDSTEKSAQFMKFSFRHV
jgi:hypothetical protein